tara:strand:+ start:44 stop:178 length:135 start_codon:yes stop_codon:yes gene_type:complete
MSNIKAKKGQLAGPFFCTLIAVILGHFGFAPIITLKGIFFTLHN